MEHRSSQSAVKQEHLHHFVSQIQAAFQCDFMKKPSLHGTNFSGIGHGTTEDNASNLCENDCTDWNLIFWHNHQMRWWHHSINTKHFFIFFDTFFKVQIFFFFAYVSFFSFQWDGLSKMLHVKWHFMTGLLFAANLTNDVLKYEADKMNLSAKSYREAALCISYLWKVWWLTFILSNYVYGLL